MRLIRVVNKSSGVKLILEFLGFTNLTKSKFSLYFSIGPYRTYSVMRIRLNESELILNTIRI